MKNLKITVALVLSILLGTLPALSWAATAVATVSVTIPVAASVSLQKGTNSDCTTAGAISFTVLDSSDMAGGSGEKMYAPLRSHTGKNWHEVVMTGTGASTTLSIAVTTNPAMGTKTLSDRLYVYCGGWWKTDGTMESGTVQDWVLAKNYTKTISKAFVGTSPFNYYVDVSGLSGSATPYTGGITFTFVST